MSFAAVVARARRVGGFPGPFEDGQLRVAAMDDDPANRTVAFLLEHLQVEGFFDEAIHGAKRGEGALHG
jgi:hypothetical protein